MSAAADIATALGAASRSGQWWRCRCPVHSSHGATLALRDGDRGGVIAVCHAGCTRAEIVAELRRRGLVGVWISGSRVPPPPRTPAIKIDDAGRIAFARRLWNTTQEAGGSPVVTYLAARGITIAPPSSLRWAPSLRRLDGSHGPAMVGVVEHAERGVVGVHRTWIAADADGVWRRIDRAALGPIRGGAVRLAPAADTLMVGEGIETCMAAMQATGMPAWAALSAGGIEMLLLPEVVRRVTILADNDANGRGQRAAWTAAQRWLAEGRQVRIAMPPESGRDFNDMLLGSVAASNTETIHA